MTYSCGHCGPGVTRGCPEHHPLVWTVLTRNSIYTVDMEGWITRQPVVPGPLRRDLLPVPLLNLLACQVGEPLVVLLRIRDDGVQTLRRTSEVVSVEPVASTGRTARPSPRPAPDSPRTAPRGD